jgi:hypothetical protein
MKIAKTIFKQGAGRQTHKPDSNTSSHRLHDTPPESNPVDRERPRQIIRLVRSAERLDEIERDLIRQISHDFEINRSMQGLLTELRMATNRLRGQLSDMERNCGMTEAAENEEETVLA